MFSVQITLLLIVTYFRAAIALKGVGYTIFIKEDTCDLPSRQAIKCAEVKTGFFGTIIECATTCAHDGRCTGVSVSEDQVCYHHFTCLETFNCSFRPDLVIFRKKGGSNTTEESTDIQTIQQTEETTDTVTIQQTKTTTPAAITTPTTTLTTTAPTTIPTTTTTPTTTPTTTTTINRICQQAGIWNETARRCLCSDGWVGTNCQRRAKDCRDLADSGYARGWAPYWIDMEVTGFPTPFPVRCNLADTYFIMYIMINKGELNHTRPWLDYVNGYKLDNYHYWLGLEKMKYFNDLGYTTVYLDTTFNYPNGENNQMQYRYDKFNLEGLDKRYKFSFDTATPYKSGSYSKKLTYGDCLRDIKGKEFSTWDNWEKDKGGKKEDLSKNCAYQSGVGWWYDDCSMECNPLGWTYTSLKSNVETPKHIKMAGLDYRLGEYAVNVATFMYFQVILP